MRRLGGFQNTAALLMMITAFSICAHAQRAEETKQREVVVSILDRQLALVEDGRVVKIYPIAVGAEVSPSPEGDFQIVNRVENPTYYHPGKVIAPGKQNPLGTRWIGLSKASFGIHGTNQPESIGKAASHGCIRMKQRDLEELFAILRVGDTVHIRGERDEQVAAIFTQRQNTQVAQSTDSDDDDSAEAGAQ